MRSVCGLPLKTLSDVNHTCPEDLFSNEGKCRKKSPVVVETDSISYKGNMPLSNFQIWRNKSNICNGKYFSSWIMCSVRVSVSFVCCRLLLIATFLRGRRKERVSTVVEVSPSVLITI